jgi:hypothetical protein
MPKQSASELDEHPAIKAWRVLQPGRVEFQGIEILEQNKKSVVYRLPGVGLGGSAVIAKRCWCKTALVERTIYEAVLPHLALPCLHYYGFVQSDDEWCWMFLEDAGRGEYSPQIEEHRLLAARWLGIMHASAARLAAASQLPDRGPNHYWARLQSAYGMIERGFAELTLNRDDRITLESILCQCDLLKGHWRKVEQWCEPVPRTLVHGDFVRKHLRVRTGPCGIALLPFDWETAGCYDRSCDRRTHTICGQHSGIVRKPRNKCLPIGCVPVLATIWCPWHTGARESRHDLSADRRGVLGLHGPDWSNVRRSDDKIHSTTALLPSRNGRCYPRAHVGKLTDGGVMH